MFHLFANGIPCLVYLCGSLRPPFVLTSFPSLLWHLRLLSLLVWTPALPIILLHMPPPTSWSQKRKSNSSVFGMLHESLSITSNLTGVTFSEDHRYQFCFPRWVLWTALAVLSHLLCLFIFLSSEWHVGLRKQSQVCSEASHAIAKLKGSLWFPHPTGASTQMQTFRLSSLPHSVSLTMKQPSGVLPPLPLAIGMFWESALLSEKPSLSLALRAPAELTEKQRNWTNKIHGGKLAPDASTLYSGSSASLDQSPVFHLLVFVHTAKGNVLSNKEPVSIFEASKNCLSPPAWEKAVGDTDGKSMS